MSEYIVILPNIPNLVKQDVELIGGEFAVGYHLQYLLLVHLGGEAFDGVDALLVLGVFEAVLDGLEDG